MKKSKKKKLPLAENSADTPAISPPYEDSETNALILAAGLGLRLGMGPKAFLNFSGQTLLGYLRPRLLDPLGIGPGYWHQHPPGRERDDVGDRRRHHRGDADSLEEGAAGEHRSNLHR